MSFRRSSASSRIFATTHALMTAALASADNTTMPHSALSICEAVGHGVHGRRKSSLRVRRDAAVGGRCDMGGPRVHQRSTTVEEVGPVIRRFGPIT